MYKAFSHSYITVVYSEKIPFCISQFVSSFFKPFWSILHTSSFHCLFTHISLLSYFYSSWFFPHAVILCVCFVFNLCFHFTISCKWFLICFCFFFLLHQYAEELSRVAGSFVGFVQDGCKGMWWLAWFSTVDWYMERKRWGTIWQWMWKI